MQATQSDPHAEESAMELILSGLGGSFVAVLFHLVELIDDLRRRSRSNAPGFPSRDG